MENQIDEYAVSSSWEAHKDFRKPFDYVLQRSQQKVLLRRADMTDLLKLGIANELDFMSKGLMQTEKTNAQDAVKDVISKAQNIDKMTIMVDKICLLGILKPKIHEPPMITETVDGQTVTRVNESARQKGLFYVDQIPWEDRMELFGVIFDSEGLSDFREEQTVGVGDVANVPSVQLSTDRSVADVPARESEGVLPQ